jgi:hypothetical protein
VPETPCDCSACEQDTLNQELKLVTPPPLPETSPALPVPLPNKFVPLDAPRTGYPRALTQRENGWLCRYCDKDACTLCEGCNHGCAGAAAYWLARMRTFDENTGAHQLVSTMTTERGVVPTRKTTKKKTTKNADRYRWRCQPCFDSNHKDCNDTPREASQKHCYCPCPQSVEYATTRTSNAKEARRLADLLPVQLTRIEFPARSIRRRRKARTDARTHA